MRDIFGYLNCRDFLRDFYQEQKAANPAFSYQYFARKAGFRSKSFLPHVIEGTRNLSREAVFKLRPALKLSDKAFAYFCDLVAFTQAVGPEERKHHLQRLLSYNARNPARVLLRSQYEFYAEWYHNTVRLLVTMGPFDGNYGRLARQLSPPITPRQARASVRLLLRLGLIRKTTNGYEQTDSHLTTGDEVRSVAVSRFHNQSLELAKRSIDATPSSERDVSCLVVDLSSDGFQRVKSEVQAFRKRLVALADSDKSPSRVYHIGFQLFPTTQPVAQGGSS